MNVRIIPRLDIKGPNLVKGINFEGLRVLGKPQQFARHYYENGADELIYMDVVASLYGRNSLLEIVERTSQEIFIPLTVGGGLRTVDDIRAVLRSGADKVSINSAAVDRPELISEAARVFGSSTIVVSIDAMKRPGGRYEVYTDYGRRPTGEDPQEWAMQAVERGAGELVITSISQEGTGKGFDIELTAPIAEAVSIPVIALGGAGKLQDICDVIRLGKTDAVSIASMLHYHFIKQMNNFDEHGFGSEGNVDFLRRGQQFTIIQDTSIQETKAYLRDQGINCRDD